MSDFAIVARLLAALPASAQANLVSAVPFYTESE